MLSEVLHSPLPAGVPWLQGLSFLHLTARWLHLFHSRYSGIRVTHQEGGVTHHEGGVTHQEGGVTHQEGGVTNTRREE